MSGSQNFKLIINQNEKIIERRLMTNMAKLYINLSINYWNSGKHMLTLFMHQKFKSVDIMNESLLIRGAIRDTLKSSHVVIMAEVHLFKMAREHFTFSNFKDAYKSIHDYSSTYFKKSEKMNIHNG